MWIRVECTRFQNNWSYMSVECRGIVLVCILKRIHVCVHVGAGGTMGGCSVGEFMCEFCNSVSAFECVGGLAKMNWLIFQVQGRPFVLVLVCWCLSRVRTRVFFFFYEEGLWMMLLVCVGTTLRVECASLCMKMWVYLCSECVKHQTTVAMIWLWYTVAMISRWCWSFCCDFYIYICFLYVFIWFWGVSVRI